MMAASARRDCASRRMALSAQVSWQRQADLLASRCPSRHATTLTLRHVLIQTTHVNGHDAGNCAPTQTHPYTYKVANIQNEHNTHHFTNQGRSHDWRMAMGCPACRKAQAASAMRIYMRTHARSASASKRGVMAMRASIFSAAIRL